MSFAIRDLSVLAYAQGFTLWHYKAGANELSETLRTGFFDDAGDMLARGDMVMVSSREGGRIICVASTQGRVETAPV